MKILFLVDNFPPEVNAPATRTFEHCIEWVKAGAEVTVITCAPNFPQGKVYPGYRNKLVQKEYMSGIRVIRVWTFMAPNKGFLKRSLDYCSFMVSAFIAGLFVRKEVIIATSPHFFTPIAGYILSLFTRKPWIMEIRDLWPDSIIAVKAMKESEIPRIFYWLEMQMYRHATRLVPVTDTFKVKIIEKGIDGSKIKVIKNGSNLEQFIAGMVKPGLREKIAGRDRIIMSYIGTLGMAHGLNFIIGCAGELDKMNVTLLLIGDGAMKNELYDQIQRGQYTNVVCLPPIPKAEVPDYLSISDIALIPLKKAEMFENVIPSKIFEASAMQIPILLGVEGEAKMLVESYNAGICYIPEDKIDFVAKTEKLIRDKELYERCKAGEANLAKDFSRKRLAGEYLEMMNRMKKQ